MARTVVTTVDPTVTGALATPVAPNADGDVIDPGARVRLLVTCGATGTTVTIPTPATYQGLAIADAGGAVAANTTRVFGPFPAGLFAQPADAAPQAGIAVASKVLVDYSSVTTVTRQVIG